MKTANFNTDLTHANSLTITSTFEYLGKAYVVQNFTKNHISVVAEDGKKIKMTPVEFEGYIYYGFIKNIKP